MGTLSSEALASTSGSTMAGLVTVSLRRRPEFADKYGNASGVPGAPVSTVEER